MPHEVHDLWNDAYRAFKGAFDTPVARRKQDDEYAKDARERLARFDEQMQRMKSPLPGCDVGTPAPVAWLRNFAEPNPHAITDLKYRSVVDAENEVAYHPVWAGGSPSAHSDDMAIDRFAHAMKAKMAKSRAKGRSGWDDPAQCDGQTLAALLIDHISKGNPGSFEDIANFAMMLHQRGEDPDLLRRTFAQHLEASRDNAAI